MPQADICPHCHETLPLVGDAFCTFCQEPLSHETNQLTDSPASNENVGPDSVPQPPRQLQHDSFRSPRPNLGKYISSYPSIKSESWIWKIATIGLVVNFLFVAIPMTLTAFCLIFGFFTFTWLLIAWKFNPHKAEVAISGLIVFDKGIRVIKNGPEYSINYDQIKELILESSKTSGIRLKLFGALDFFTNEIANQPNAKNEIDLIVAGNPSPDMDGQSPPLSFKLLAVALALIGLLVTLFCVFCCVFMLYWIFTSDNESSKGAGDLLGVSIVSTLTFLNFFPFAKSLNTSNRYSGLMASFIVPTVLILFIKSVWFVLQARMGDSEWIGLASFGAEIFEWCAFAAGCFTFIQVYLHWDMLRCSCFFFEPGYFSGLKKQLTGR